MGPVRGLCGPHEGHEIAEGRDVQKKLMEGAGCVGEQDNDWMGVSPKWPQSL